MLAAAPAHSGQPLDLFVLALTLATVQSAPSAALADHFNETLKQARAVLSDPSSINGGVSNEAVQLALEMRADPNVRSSLEAVDSFAQVTPKLAADLLKEMSIPLEA